MFSATWRQPPKKLRIFFKMRFRSLTDALGFRLPMELTQSMRFFRDSRSMMCFLLNGSPSQSLLKQIMSCPSIIILWLRHGCLAFVEAHNLDFAAKSRLSFRL